jgi:hypothetical protein
MNTITSSGTLTCSGTTLYYQPFGAPSPSEIIFPQSIVGGVIVTFGSDLILTTTSQYFTIAGSGVIIDGAGYEIDFSGIDTQLGSYNGFIDGNNQTNSTVQNIGCINSGTSGVTSYISRGNFTTGSTISKCYVICSGSIQTGIAYSTNSASISNCYVICGGNIQNGGGIAGIGNSASGTISHCYVICGGNIQNGGGIAGSGNAATIDNCYVNYNTISNTDNIIAVTGGTGTISSCGSSNTPKWTSAGAAKLSSGWTNTDATKPWLLSAFNTEIVTPTTRTTTSASGSIGLNDYGQTFANGSVYSGTTGFTYNAPNSIGYSGISTGTYTLGLYAYDLLNNLTTISFSFTNDAQIKAAYNYNIAVATAEDIVPYTYSVTNNVSLTYSAAVDCFLEGTKILTDKGYVQIEKLSKNDLIVTPEGDKNIYKLGKCSIVNLGVQERIKDQLYVCTSENYKEITEDLVMTGCHSVLVDSFVSYQQARETVDLLKKLYVTGNKLRLPVCLDERARVYEEKGEKTIYHIALENNHYDGNYGIYANGLLVESCSMNYIDNKSKLTCMEI